MNRPASSFRVFLLLNVISFGLLHQGLAENWPNWRGPNFDGSSNEIGLPGKFSKEDGVVWRAPLPGPAGSTPIVWGDHVFLTSANEDSSGILAMCLSASTGDIKWSYQFSDDAMRDTRTNTAGPSAVTDGELVYFFTGSGDLAAYDFEGTQVWQRSIEDDYGPFAMQWTFSSSPQLAHQTLYLQILQRDEPVNERGNTDGPIDSFLLAMDPKTGDTKWRHIRPNQALKESKEAFSTPIPITHNGRNELLIAGGDCLTGHDPSTGEELWRWGTYNPGQVHHWRLVPTPVYGQGTILVCTPKKNPVHAISAGGSGDISSSGNIWTSEGKEVTSDVPTPLFYDGYFYVLNGGTKFLSCLHPTSGKVLWTTRIDGKQKIESSPVGVDGKIYFMSQMGEVFVYSAGPEGGALINSTLFGVEQSVNIRSSIVPANGTLYIRTDDSLYAVRK
ncbi:MAG: PQQ-binding-like beta-propeller repeat protein [Verrucomicrobiota bacterium]